MKYSQGSFQVLLFGEYGNKLDKHSANSYKESRAIASKHIEANKNNSAVINRTVWNSKDLNNKWDYKDDNG